ncbi:methylated-DNA--[protein]-cysteine S-methyltransferase [Pseudonocardia sp.]|uniref:methylated-DNA--[protein]-cysteine S-methyltransferase n=1 Tax=Pseudonocardia sp. TaxID=60912 RepID=UPI00262E5392|nr:methylated-DNA--[protein]-cysteine S-methyltransferase [Pseudonocardia sp.]MCW2716654.1 hypothetical protein [Pseudonocardia sp.]
MASTTASPARWYTVVPTALGQLTLVRDADALLGLYYPHHWYKPNPATFGPRSHEGFSGVIGQLCEYFTGRRQTFDLALALVGSTFQCRVWNLVAQVPYGATVTYGALAATLGGDVTAQQVGAAVGRNPLCILVPCHRVVGADGKLTGYAGGVGRKRHLLDLEQACRPASVPTQEALLLDLWSMPGSAVS